MKYKSCAEWPSDLYTGADGSHISTDLHETKVEADSVCVMLRRRGWAGGMVFPVRFPVRTWVVEVSDE